ncbi:porin family protein [Desulfopila aestuarii]|uniref:Porin n=1 Tax=Desulfopila aestuarii DSM 18488 TaxID=1121416 RepID=A0A1M7YCR1_9BACT|nr:hypothetical protein [Desulfopila aestuarii]SHO50393.1 hypothetical protein SAMN02745220_03396 [Desulfopila aestuarii DSM 18488]
MNRKQRALLAGAGALLMAQFVPAVQAEAKQVTVDAKMLEQLQQLVMDQQKQLDKLQQQVDQFQQTAVAAQTQAQEAKTVAEEVKTSSQAAKTVVSGSERVKLAVSGQVNRAVNVADDGDQTDAYFVDNGASNSRIRFVGTGAMSEDLTLGTNLEIALAPNLSGDVSQSKQESGDFFEERVAELYLQSKQYGKVSLGKGSTPSDGTAEVDLSGTDVIQYASYADIAGGLLFRESSTNMLTGVKVSNAFNDFDGLSRKSRLRYDSPLFYGFGVAGSVISDSRWDTALRWSGSGYGFKAGAAAAVAYVNESNADYQYDGSLSLLHEETGLNLTFSAGTKDADNGDDPYSIYTKLGWQTQFCPLGKTSFGLDYGYGENISASGDEGDSFGFAMVQTIAEYGTELYFQFRQYSLDRDSMYADVDDINVGTIGARVKF